MSGVCYAKIKFHDVKDAPLCRRKDAIAFTRNLDRVSCPECKRIVDGWSEDERKAQEEARTKAASA